MPYLAILMVVAFAVFFYRAAKIENESGLLWCGLSVVISIATLFFFGWGWLGTVLGQAGLFAGITLFRMTRKP
ncbi:MAG: hypothetical protein ABSD57_05040 [Verrucomicrobiota bacterium]|jgi:hypothetical protein